MTIDRTLPPTNKQLLECGPEGVSTEGNTDGSIVIVVRGFYDPGWSLSLEISRFSKGKKKRDVVLRFLGPRVPPSVVSHGRVQWWMHIGHVTTLGEVIDLYELLSQKKWPT